MKSNWQADFFQGVALEFWRRAMSPEQTRSQVDFLEKTLAAGLNAQLLDVPCGNGRHAAELAGRGYSLTGVDSSEESIHEARTNPLPIRWVLGDMCDLPWMRHRLENAFVRSLSFNQNRFWSRAMMMMMMSPTN